MALPRAQKSRRRPARRGRPPIGPKITVHVSDWADEEIRRYAASSGRTLSDVRREAVERGLTAMLSAAVL